LQGTSIDVDNSEQQVITSSNCLQDEPGGLIRSSLYQIIVDESKTSFKKLILVTQKHKTPFPLIIATILIVQLPHLDISLLD